MTENERIERFEASYNRIERGLNDVIGERPDQRRRGFAAKVRMAANRHRRFGPFVDFLLEIGDLRNALVHNRTGDDMYLAIPSEATVLELERIEQKILQPERVEKHYLHPVITLHPEQTLAEAFELIRGNGYSRYPVYDNNRFVGLVTANGFTRWVAKQMKNAKIEIDASKVCIGDIIEHDHRRENATFVSRKAIIDDVELLFGRKQSLEAVLITEHGREDEQPIGMICPADITNRNGAR